MQKTNMEAAHEEAAKQDALRKRAARQAAKAQALPAEPDTVPVRVLKLGADKISMGVHIAKSGDAYYEKGETFSCPRPTAEHYEGIGWVEIEDGQTAVHIDPATAPKVAAEPVLKLKADA